MTFSAQMAKIAAHESWARTKDRSERTRRARRAMEEKFLYQVDPEQKLPIDVRQKMADSARKAHYRRMALASARARRGQADEATRKVPDTR